MMRGSRRKLMLMKATGFWSGSLGFVSPSAAGSKSEIRTRIVSRRLGRPAVSEPPGDGGGSLTRPPPTDPYLGVTNGLAMLRLLPMNDPGSRM